MKRFLNVYNFTLKTAVIKKNGKSNIAAPVSPKLVFNSMTGSGVDSGHVKTEYPENKIFIFISQINVNIKYLHL